MESARDFIYNHNNSCLKLIEMHQTIFFAEFRVAFSKFCCFVLASRFFLLEVVRYIECPTFRRPSHRSNMVYMIVCSCMRLFITFLAAIYRELIDYKEQVQRKRKMKKE
jgi:hypothetical protein